MKQRFFEQQGEPRWLRVEQMLASLEGGESCDTSEFPQLYRRLCQDLALARDRQLPSRVVDRLNLLALRGHQHLYGARVRRKGRLLDFVSREFPRAVRAEWRLLVFAGALFYGSALLVGWLVYAQPDLIYSFIDQSNLAELEAMYDPANRTEGPRASEDNVLMFGFYIWNNIGIAFRTFASGMVFGVGTLFVLLFNGLYFGLIASHLTRLGFTETFYSFVIGHGAFELTAILLAGVAGMRLGLSLLAPGPRSRLQSLRNASRASLPIVYGCAGMLLLAAGIEAFWSPNQMFSPQVKYAVGAYLWLLVIAYLCVAGRGGARVGPGEERGRAA